MGFLGSQFICLDKFFKYSNFMIETKKKAGTIYFLIIRNIIFIKKATKFSRHNFIL